MRKEEKRIYITCITGMAVAVVMAVVLMTRPVSAENAVFADATERAEEFTAEPSGTPETGQIRENTPMSDMPCENPEAFERWLETYEQETSEEVEDSERCEDGAEVPKHEAHLSVSETETPEIQADVRTDCPIYQVDGQTLNPDIQAYLYQRLAEFHCEFFFRYALCQIYQESRFNAAAENPNGLDKGICQFRLPYFGELAREAGLVEYDIFNPIDSIYVYTYLMCKYLNETGGDVAMSLSLYYSGYGGLYSSEYVRDVTQWFETMKEVEQ